MFEKHFDLNDTLLNAYGDFKANPNTDLEHNGIYPDIMIYDEFVNANNDDNALRMIQHNQLIIDRVLNTMMSGADFYASADKIKALSDIDNHMFDLKRMMRTAA